MMKIPTLNHNAIRLSRLVLLAFFTLVFATAQKLSAQCPTPPSYCTPTSSVFNTGTQIGIFNVNLGTISNYTGIPSQPYTDYTNLSTVTTAGATVSLSIQVGTVNPQSIRMYIDWNLDGTFGTGAPELAFQAGTTASGITGTTTGSITVPTGQAAGAYRVRVVADFYAYNPTPCTNYYAEHEDYLIIVGSAVPNIAALNLTSPTAFAIGNNTITLRFQNQGGPTVNTASFGWNCTNGQSGTGSTTGMGLTTGNISTYTFTSQLNLVAGTYTLKVWVNNPNGIQPDANPCNDTLVITACTGISGAYTINPSGSGSNNFTSFTLAAQRLTSCGVAGPVTFTVAPGTYTEQVIIGPINGASATNTVTFDGVDSTTRILTYNSTNASLPATFMLNGADYVIIKNMRINATNGTYAIPVQITNVANYNIVENCILTMSATGTSNYMVGVGICGATYSTAGNHGNYNIVRNNRIEGGYCSISNMGPSGSQFSQGNQFLNNRLNNAYLFGIYAYYNNLSDYNDNKVMLRPGTVNTYGIYTYYNNNFKMDRNVVRADYMGLYIYFNNYTNSPGTGSVTNNFVYGMKYSSHYPMYAYYTSNTNYFHNTIVQPAGTANTAYCAYMGYGSNNHCRNNIFYNLNSTGTQAWGLYVINSSPFVTFDYNIIYSAHPSNYAYWGTNTSNLAALKSQSTAFNQNTWNSTVDFVNITSGSEDLHLKSNNPAQTGDRTVGLAVDVDNEARCTFAPTVGADESKFLNPPPTAGFTVGTVYVNSPVTFINNNPPNMPMAHSWYVDGALVSNTVNYSTMFTTTGVRAIKLVTQGCAGIDSVTVNVNVVNPSNPPVSNFISDINVTPAYGIVKFTDLSTGGAQSWAWTVTPGVQGIDWSFTGGTTSASQNPQISFATPGNYNVCLRASNSTGSGTNNCKTAYIIVQSSNSMCIYPFSSNVASGNLFDSGGPSATYSQNENCLFTIDACGDSTYLTFSALNMGTGTADRILIYNNADGTGTPIATFTGGINYTLPITVAAGRYMTIREQTDATSNNGPGFAAVWTIKQGSFTAPTGDIVGPDTAYYCSTPPVVSIYSSSFVDADYTYTWDFENDGIDDAIGKGLSSAQYAYGSTGVYVNKLTVSGCGGTFVDYDTILVTNAITPDAAFATNLNTATVSDTISLTDLSNYGPNAWTWTITGPGNPVFVTGTANSRNPKIILPTPGSYSVKLKVCNCAGCDSATVSSFINVIGYCTPAVGALNPDLAIKNIQFENINYTATVPAPGLIDYRNLSQTVAPAFVDRGALYNFKLTRNSNYNAANKKIWIDWNKDGIFDPITELASSGAANTDMIWNTTFTVPKTAALGATRMRVSLGYNNLSNTPCGPIAYGEYQDYRLIVRPDVTKPIITRKYIDSVSIEIGYTYVDSGATAYDAVDGIITDSIYTTGFVTGRATTSPVVASTLGTFNVYYNVMDNSGNAADQVMRKVGVTPDVTKPVITITGSNPEYHEVGTPFVDSGATATDFYFGPITPVNAASNVNDAVLGTYTITYTATDASGNAADPKVRTVTIGDKQSPVIVFPPNTDTVYVEVNNPYVDPGATVTDNYYNNITPTMNGAVNVFGLGTYTLIFNATDGSGNVATPRMRRVIVRDLTAPKLELAGADTMVIEVNTLSTVPEPGWVVTDNYYAQSQITVSKTGTVNLNVLGDYTVTYQAIDGSGNQTPTITRVYRIVDTSKPVITLNGGSTVNLCRWQTFSDPGVTITDNYYSGLMVTTTSNLDVNLPGIYVISYNTVDGSGNIANTAYRFVNIIDCSAQTGIDAKGLSQSINVYPNPTVGDITIDIELAKTEQIRISVYNSIGQMVKLVDDATILGAQYKVDLSNFAGGVYFVRFDAENESITKKVTLNK